MLVLVDLVINGGLHFTLIMRSFQIIHPSGLMVA